MLLYKNEPEKNHARPKPTKHAQMQFTYVASDFCSSVRPKLHPAKGNILKPACRLGLAWSFRSSAA